ncbi:restriction endonuclease [Alteromonas sp. 1_MG-2023]|uniref:restriction endonuclease n=1 Tax=Alteromonas sp. 1_MG-2023 TaxID=3062669 RepID=UPI0026E24317|nr:restriction endonuclease [Alteromonas sp. 1_MG-2023]MDO6566494.1 restriction endonuclease [Alteromonas sp. 1_MG-2023]
MGLDFENSKVLLMRGPVELISEGYAGIGWGQFELFKFKTADDLYKHLESTQQSVGRSGNQLRRYIEVKQGDLIVVPAPARIYIGIATGEKQFCADKPWGENQIQVDFPCDADSKPISIARTDLKQGLQSRLRIRLTVADLDYFKDEIIERYNDTKNNVSSGALSKVNEQIGEKFEQFKAKLLNNLRNRNHYLEAGGQGLEHLVKELLEIEGYTAIIPSKQSHEVGVDVDIEAQSRNPFITQELLVQVKDHVGYTDKHAITQIADAKKGDVCSRWVISLADFNEDAKNYADELSVKLMNGNEFVDWLAERWQDLSPTTQQKLGIASAPQIVL